MEIKWLATTLGMERLWIKKGKMNCYFVQNQQSAFYSSEVFGKIIKYMGFMPQGVQMKEKGKYLIMTFSDLHSMEEAQGKLVELGEFVYGNN